MFRKIANKNTAQIFLVNFLPLFMLFIFGPAEIFFANAAEFEFVYGEFAGYLAAAAAAAALFVTLIEALLPDKWRRAPLSVCFGIAVAGYLQIMFWNKNLDMLGLNPEGYQANGGAALNLAFWIILILIVTALSFWKSEIWQKVIFYVSALILCMQLAGMVSLMVTAKPDAYRHEARAWRLSGEDQFKVSADKNIIVLILDYLGSDALARMQEVYPQSTDFLHDFTCYDNADCVYFGTYPSIPHMMTGCELDMSKRVDEWCADIWQDERTERFYRDLHEAGYITNLYTPDVNVLCGLNSTEILKDKISNLENIPQEIDVYYSLLLKTMSKMSAYRMAPEWFKPYFYTDMAEYSGVIRYRNSEILHENYYFYDELRGKGLTADASSHYLIVQHLMGAHDSATDADCRQREVGGPIEDSAKGSMVLVEEYLEQLKALGVYDDAAIIITADHGDYTWAQVLFYVKAPGETHAASPVNHAPISHCEFLPTLAEYAGLDYTQYGSGRSIHDYAENAVRERTFWGREYNKAYPSVPCYTGVKSGWCNVYDGYTYTGDVEAVKQIDWNAPDIVVPMADSFF